MATSRARQRVVPFLLAASALCGCFLDAGNKNACVTQGDCLDDYTCWHGSCLSDPTWGCLGIPALGEPPDVPIAIRLSLLDAGTEAPVAGAIVRLCRRADTNCAAPIVAMTDAQGSVQLEMADEYLEIEAPGYRRTIASSVLSLEVTTAGVVPLEVHFDVFSDADFSSMASGTGVVTDAQRGDVEVLVRDCAYESAGGARVDLDASEPPTALRYLVNDIPSTTATETDTASGEALYFNAPPGLRSVSAILAATGEPIGGAGGQTVIARPGWLSHVAVAPPGVRITDARGD